jgi:uncharacterized protein (TIGR03437 family)
MRRRHGYITRLVCGGIFAFSAISAAQVPAASTAPSYNAAGIVNAATQIAGILAPNSIATIYGTNLSYNTHAVDPGDLNGGTLPIALEGVSVYVNGILGGLFYVSPGQINFLIPYDITALSATVYVERQGIAGPAVIIPLANTSPGFFQWNGAFAVATHADGSLISASAPADASEIIVLYAAGLGRTSPDVPSGHIVSVATSILYASELQILLNGAPCPASSIYYAGLTPGFAGLYQINLMLPAVLPPDPEIQMVIGTQASPALVQIFTQ